jgi:hypothetical protein
MALPEAYFRVQDVSPDGTRLLGVSWSDAQRRFVLAQYALQNGTLDLMTDFPTNVLFTPDGGLAGVQRIQGKAVVGVWPPHGGSFKAIVPPTSDLVYGGAVSRTGRIAISRGQTTSDVVLITAKQEKK